jgi:hypothetical protein
MYRIISGRAWTDKPRTSLSQSVSQPLFFADDPVVKYVIESSRLDEEIQCEQQVTPGIPQLPRFDLAP